MSAAFRLLKAAAAAFLLAGLFAAPAISQPRQPAANAAQASAAAAFARFDLAERRAIQRDLIWVAGFTGVASGEFGPLTFQALRKLDETLRKPVNGQLDAAKRRALASAADSARQNMGFRLETDPVSNMRIGVPNKVLSRRSTGPAGLSRWQDSEEKITLDLNLGKPDDTLADLFERGTSARVPGRRITYRLLGADFFVISGETQNGKFYRRLEKGSDGVLRGFSIGYDKTLAAGFDWMVIAIAASFEAEPSASPSGQVAVATPKTERPASLEPRRLTAIEIAPGRLLTAAAPLASCRTISVGATGQPARIEKQGNGLALLSFRQPQAAVLTIASAGEGGAILLQRDRTGELLTGAAYVTGGLAEAPLQIGGAGAALLDPAGRVMALVVEEPHARTQIAGIVLAGRYRVVPAPELASFAEVQPAGEGRDPRSMSAIAAEAGRGIVSLICAD